MKLIKNLVTSNLSRQNTLNEILQDDMNVADIFSSSYLKYLYIKNWILNVEKYKYSR